MSRRSTPGTKPSVAGGSRGGRSNAAAGRRPEAEPGPPPDWPQLVPWVCLHLMVAVVPLAVSDLTWLGFETPLTLDSFDAPKVFLLQALTLLSAGAWGWSALSQGTCIRHSWVFWLLLAFLGWALLATVLSIHVPTALVGKARRLEGFVSFACYGWLLFLAVQEVTTAERVRSLARTLVVASVAIGAYGVLQYFGHDFIERGALPFAANRGFSTLGNPDLLGGYLMFPLPLALALAWTERHLVWKVVYWAGFLVLVAAWVTAYVRGAWIGGIVALALLALLVVWLRLAPTPVDLGFVVVSVGSVAAFSVRSLSSSSEVTNVVSRFRSILDFSEASAVTRFEIWQAALRAAKDRPIFGYGPDTFRLVFPRYKPATYVRDAGYQSVADNAHNYVLQSAVGLGIPGALLLYGLFVAVLASTLPSVLRRQTPEVTLLRGAFWLACMGYLVHLMFGISVSGSSTLLWISLGVLVAPIAAERVVAAPVWGKWTRYPVVALAALALAASFSLFAADHYYLASEASAGTDAQVPAAERAITLNPFLIAYRTNLAEAHSEQQQRWAQMAASSTQGGASATEAVANARLEYEAATDAFQRAIDFAPWEYDHYANLAVIYLRGGDAEKALAVARRGLDVSPNDPQCRVLAASALQSLRRIDEAIAVAQEAVRLDLRYPEAHAVLGDLYRAKGQTRAARREYQAALDIDPNGRLAGLLQESIASLDASAATQ